MTDNAPSASFSTDFSFDPSSHTIVGFPTRSVFTALNTGCTRLVEQRLEEKRAVFFMPNDVVEKNEYSEGPPRLQGAPFWFSPQWRQDAGHPGRRSRLLWGPRAWGLWRLLLDLACRQAPEGQHRLCPLREGEGSSSTTCRLEGPLSGWSGSRADVTQIIISFEEMYELSIQKCPRIIFYLNNYLHLYIRWDGNRKIFV